ncbi:hypothetical protein L1987_55771 [Smallanthus sonchifolius]|uniref:Uncharacterized protein n=1 Tax=Smallanthus sonchifolius TaxID=185202 RepID=A0ACB9EBB7_9ASTR|nr:hypothetical protein L1987_55771 [Smallanthus sonchifolius]
MLSIDEHPPKDPSSSHNHNLQQQQEVGSYEAFPSVSDIDLLKPTDANLDDTNNPLPKFSIRDYAFESRCKDIARCWPFSDKNLQHCLNNGVKNLLPPSSLLIQ